MTFPSFIAGLLLLSDLSSATPVNQIQSRNSTAEPVVSGFKSCDALVAAGLGDRILFPSDPNYSERISSYWSVSVQQRPWCIIQPQSAEEVSLALTTLTKLSPAGNWNVAIRSGGHNHWLSNNIKYGVTIDLGLLNETVYDKSTGLASIGPGARWGSVFETIEQYGLTVTGGRDGFVGVGGFLLGGGNSFHSGRRGFGCDDVMNYEVVLASGEIVDANAAVNSDLFKALKGGGNNFGIVTRFDMATFEGKELWGGLRVSSNDYKADILDHFVRLVDNSHLHPEDAEIVVFGHFPAIMEGLSIMYTTVNTDGMDNSTSFAELENIPTVQNGIQKWSYSSWINTYYTPGGQRAVWFSTTTKNNIDVLTKLTELHEVFVADLKTDIAAADFGTQFIIQPLPTYFADLGAAKGGNVLGLDSSLTENQVLHLFIVTMQTEEQESLVYGKLSALVAEYEAYAATSGADAQWRYLNYANPTQDPLKGYGAKNIAFLHEVSAKYDPTGVFQSRIPGGFKISRVE